MHSWLHHFMASGVQREKEEDRQLSSYSQIPTLAFQPLCHGATRLGIKPSTHTVTLRDISNLSDER